MKYLEFLENEKSKYLLIIDNCSETIERYNVFKSRIEKKIQNLPTDVDRNTEYAKKYNQTLSNQRLICQQKLSEYEDVIQFEQQQINDAKESVLKIQEEINSIVDK